MAPQPTLAPAQRPSHRAAQFPLSDPSQPRPLRLIAAGATAIFLIIGGLPTLGVNISPELLGWLFGVVGALGSLAVALIGEQYVTPQRAPRAKDGTPLVRGDDQTGPATS